MKKIATITTSLLLLIGGIQIAFADCAESVSVNDSFVSDMFSLASFTHCDNPVYGDLSVNTSISSNSKSFNAGDTVVVNFSTSFSMPALWYFGNRNYSINASNGQRVSVTVFNSSSLSSMLVLTLNSPASSVSAVYDIDNASNNQLSHGHTYNKPISTPAMAPVVNIRFQ